MPPLRHIPGDMPPAQPYGHKIGIEARFSQLAGTRVHGSIALALAEFDGIDKLPYDEPPPYASYAWKVQCCASALRLMRPVSPENTTCRVIRIASGDGMPRTQFLLSVSGAASAAGDCPGGDGLGMADESHLVILTESYLGRHRNPGHTFRGNEYHHYLARS